MFKKILAGVLLAALVAGGAGWYYLDYRVRSEIDLRLQAAVDNGSYEALYYEDMSLALNGSVSISRLHVKKAGVEYILEQVAASNLDYENDIPRQIDIHISGISFPAGLPDFSDSDSATMGQLIQRGVQGDTIPLQLAYSHHYDPENAYQLDSSIEVNIPRLLDLNFDSRMRNVSIESITNLQADPNDPLALQMELMQLMSKAEFASLLLSVKDDGLVQAYMEIAAADFATRPEDYRSMLVSQVRNLYLLLPQNAQGLAMNAGIQVAAFLEGGKTLTLKLQPQFDGSLEKLQPQIMGAALTGDYARIVDLLKLELSAE